MGYLRRGSSSLSVMPSGPFSPERLTAAVDAALPLAAALFEEIRSATVDENGVSREPWRKGEQLALDVLARAAGTLDLRQHADPFGNLYLTLPGADPAAPAWLAGSHVDSVPRGGNFDGLAGVIAGITALAAFRQSGVVPPR